MPIKRYVDYLQRRNKLEEYMQVTHSPHLHAHDFVLQTLAPAELAMSVSPFEVQSWQDDMLYVLLLSKWLHQCQMLFAVIGHKPVGNECNRF